MDRVAEQLDEAMQRRREKVEQWRLARRPKTTDPAGTSSSTATADKPGEGRGQETQAQREAREWSLDKEDDEEDVVQPPASANGNGKARLVGFINYNHKFPCPGPKS